MHRFRPKASRSNRGSRGLNIREDPRKATGLDGWPLLLYYFYEMVNPA